MPTPLTVIMLTSRDDTSDTMFGTSIKDARGFVPGGRQSSASTLVGNVSFSAVPPVSAYADWQAANPKGTGQTYTPAQIRRIALMRRNGYSFSEIKSVLGKCGAEKVWNALPEGLQ